MVASADISSKKNSKRDLNSLQYKNKSCGEGKKRNLSSRVCFFVSLFHPTYHCCTVGPFIIILVQKTPNVPTNVHDFSISRYGEEINGKVASITKMQLLLMIHTTTSDSRYSSVLLVQFWLTGTMYKG